MKPYAEYKKELSTVLGKIARDQKLLTDFLEDLLTPQEYKDIAKRWQVVKQLDRGIPQRDIGRNLKVSISKITRGSRELSDTTGGFAQVLTHLDSKHHEK